MDPCDILLEKSMEKSLEEFLEEPQVEFLDRTLEELSCDPLLDEILEDQAGMLGGI